MIGLTLALALIPQGTNQARLHPADALVMVEVPDVAKMLAAYEKAPMIAMLRDAEVRKAFYGAFEGTEIDIDSMMADALQAAGMPESFAKAPRAGVRHYLEGISAASFSLSLDRRTLEEFGPRAARLGKIGEQLAAIDAAIEAYVGGAEAGAATLPKDLATLGLDAAALVDPWGRAYEYVVQPDGTYTLRSLGADGKVGGTGENEDVGSDAANLAAATFVDLLGFQLVVEFRSQPALDEMRTMVSGLIEKAGAETARSGPFQMSGVQGELQSWKTDAPNLQNLEFWMMRAQNMLVFGSGRSSPEAFAARLADPRVQTAAEQFYAGLQKNFGASTGATIVQGALRLSDYTAALQQFAAESDGDVETFEMLDGALPNASLRMQLVGERFVTEASASYPKPNKLVSRALGLAPLPPELLTSIPEDAIGVYVASVDGPLMWEALKDELSGDSPDSPSPQDQLSDFEKQYNFSVEKDIFGSIGKGVVMYMLPLKGITSIPGMAMVVEVKDPAAMQRGIEGVMALLQEEAGEDFRVRNKPYRDAPLWTFSFGQDEDSAPNPLMNAFSPSITLVKNRLIVALNSTHIKKEIKRALGEETGVHVIATEGHRPPADATAYAYMDWAHLLGGVYEGGRGLANLMGGDLPVDVSALPEPGVFTHFFKPTLYYTRTIPGGTYLRNESSFGPEVWLGLIGAGAVVGVSASRQASMDVEVEFGDEEPIAPPAEPVDKAVPADAAATKTSLRYVSTRIAVFQMDTGKFPASLDALSAPTANYPNGFLGKEGLPKDGWGRALLYTTLENGARYRLWSPGPDGVDQQGGGDDLVSP
jgi:hypothetical protein